MEDPFGSKGPLVSVPELWGQFLKAGYFFSDLGLHQSTLSRFMAALGYQSSDFASGLFEDLVHPSDLPAYRALWKRVEDGYEDEFFAEYRIRTKRGGYRWVQTSALVVARDERQGVKQILGQDRDISLRKQSESLLHSRFVDLEKQLRLSESLRVAGSAISASLVLENTVPTILEQACSLFPFVGARIWALRDGRMDLLGQEEDSCGGLVVSPLTSPLVERVARERTPVIYDDIAGRVGGEIPGFHASWIGIPLIFQNEARGVMEFWHEEPGFYRSEHIWPALAFAENVAVGLFNADQYRASLEASETDVLTGLGTRRRLERLGPELFRQAVDHQENLAAFMIDLDYFKTINDTFGHAQGDRVLRHLAKSCFKVLRKDDLICRNGGDEFVALLPRTAPKEAERVAQRLRAIFKQRSFPFANQKVSFSLGISLVDPLKHQTWEDLVHQADTALYLVKARGRDGIEFA